MIDGYEVNIGDNVYVSGIGTGTVISVNPDGGFSVRTGSGITYYRDGGFIGNIRKVYWADPIIINPPKDAQLWNTYKELAVNNYVMLSSLFATGRIPVIDETNE